VQRAVLAPVRRERYGDELAVGRRLVEVDRHPPLRLASVRVDDDPLGFPIVGSSKLDQHGLLQRRIHLQGEQATRARPHFPVRSLALRQ